MTQDYIGTKQVTAWPQQGGPKVRVCGRDCSQGDSSCNGYCAGKADHPPALEQVPGYAVKYADGYVSWSPKDVFEEAYVCIGHVSGRPAHQQRVIGEKAQLDDKIEKLSAFIGSPGFNSLAQPERHRLEHQGALMRSYSNVLGERISAF